VPYPFAHPLAVLPLVRPMGRFAVPSALVIGSITPDLWYLVPFISRTESHSASALLWFCLPAGLIVYELFHLLLKHPLIALLPQALARRLGSFTTPAMPVVPWCAVVASLLVGALTHLVWDGLTHSNNDFGHGRNWLQHANTVLGTAILCWWIWRKLRHAPVVEPTVVLSSFARRCTIAMLVAAMAASAYWATADAAPWLSLDLATLRRFLRSAGMAALGGLCVALLAYCVLWQLRAGRINSAR
jgi:hypothetical protein